MDDAARLVALGDSITVGRGEPFDGVPCRPWVGWLAETLELELANLAVEGVGASAVRTDQLPQTGPVNALGCLYVGVNDVRDPAWDALAYARDLAAILDGLVPRCARTLILTVPRDLGRPRAGEAKVGEVNAIIRAEARARGLVLAELDDLAGAPLVLDDAVHLTALGQREIADRATRALAAAPPGML